MDLDDALQTFILESRELLENMESALLSVEQAQDRGELINAIFRAAHTIKGSAGLFSLDHVVAFAHVMESVLDRVRDGTQAIDGALVALLLDCGDHIGSLVDGLAAGELSGSDELTAHGAPLVARLSTYLPAPPAVTQAVRTTPSRSPAETSQADTQPLQRMECDGLGADHWHISVRFGPDVLKNGLDPLSFIRYLGTIGAITGIATLPDGIPAVEHMDPEACYLGFEIALETGADKAEIERAFEFVRDECTLLILPPRSMVSEYIRQLQQHEGDLNRLGDMLVACGTLTQQELQIALGEQASHPEKPIGTILLEQGSVHVEVVDAALTKQKQIKEAAATENRSIRIDADKLDQLINLVGELIIAGASVNLIAQRAQVADLQESTSKLSMLVEEVRDSALQLRMVKIGATFNRFQRVVHDVARDLGKDVALVIHGEDTELDKTVVEKIGDPLMHLVRNSLDHGIESAECAPPPASRHRAPSRSTPFTTRAASSSPCRTTAVASTASACWPKPLSAAWWSRPTPERQRGLCPDLRARLLHRREGHQPVRPRRGHGRGQTQHHRAARHGGHQQRRGPRHHRHRAPAADAGHHRRLFGRCGQGRVCHSAGHD
jgi:two-component system chemotaxis sensor kinase CheA